MDSLSASERTAKLDTRNEAENSESSSREIGWNDLDPAKYVISSAVLWTLQDGSVYPFDVVKARLQVQGAIPNTNFRYRNTWDSFKQMLKQEGQRVFGKALGLKLQGLFPHKLFTLAVMNL